MKNAWGRCSELSDEKEKEPEEQVRLDWKDYVAVVIAAFQTTLLPFVIVIIVLLFLILMFRR